jgi:GTP-binding protein HflX
MPTVATEPERPRSVLAAVRVQGVTEGEHAASLVELKRLVTTLGFEVVATVSQVRPRLDPGVVFGEGKLVELARFTGGTGRVPRGPKKKKRQEEALPSDGPEGEVEPRADGPEDEVEPRADGPEDEVEPRADVIVVDHELSPQQLRNLEKATSAEVLDRTGVIVEIFHRHARSREARLQVEIARLTYLAPRLRETGGQRQRGGIGQKGAGESAIELDRRKLRDRLAELKTELAAIEGEAKTRRARRQQAQRCALVGYTNAGKSSLMRALTGSEVYVADKLFATLDTTVRALQPETRPRILVSDTVGFIKKLPHDLVASFRSTLDEALEASVLLHVVDE